MYIGLQIWGPTKIKSRILEFLKIDIEPYIPNQIQVYVYALNIFT